jgi:hypothetical protein
MLARRPNGGREPVARLAAMPRPPLFLLSVALGAVVAVALASCGEDDEGGTIPPQNASAMLQDLDDARGEQSSGDCEGLADAAGNLRTEIDGLPDTVDTEVKTALIEGAENLQNQALDESECQPTGPTGSSGPQTDEETEPPPTTPTETDTTTETETEGEPPPEQPGNEGGGNLGEGDEGGQPPGHGGEPPGQGGESPGESEGPSETGGTGGGGISP